MSNKKPKIAIVGFGSMGQEVEAEALKQGYTITNIFDIDSPINLKAKYDFDVAIDFTYPDSVMGNVEILSKLKKNIVIGTTGWQKYQPLIKDIVLDSGIGLVHGSNFAIGMQLFFKSLEYTSKMLNSISGFDIMVHELHHHRKKDSPSGSAKTIGDIILANYKKKKSIEINAIQGAINDDALHISSTRGGEITGIHTVYIDSPADTLEMTHRAKNRNGFAVGALIAASWIHGKSGFFEFSEILDDLWRGK